MKHHVEREWPQAPVSGFNDGVAVVGGLTAYVGFAVWVHAAWIGVAPFG